MLDPSTSKRTEVRWAHTRHDKAEADKKSAGVVARKFLKK